MIKPVILPHNELGLFIKVEGGELTTSFLVTILLDDGRLVAAPRFPSRAKAMAYCDLAVRAAKVLDPQALIVLELSEEDQISFS